MRSNLEPRRKNKELDKLYTNLNLGLQVCAAIGAGTNRMNLYTVRQATEGLARFIEEQGEEAKKRGVVIAYDSATNHQNFH